MRRRRRALWAVRPCVWAVRPTRPDSRQGRRAWCQAAAETRSPALQRGPGAVQLARRAVRQRRPAALPQPRLGAAAGWPAAGGGWRIRAMFRISGYHGPEKLGCIFWSAQGAASKNRIMSGPEKLGKRFSLFMSQVNSGRFRSRACRDSDRPTLAVWANIQRVQTRIGPVTGGSRGAARGVHVSTPRSPRQFYSFTSCVSFITHVVAASRADSPRPHVRLAQWPRREAAPMGRAKEMPNQRRGLVGPGKSRRGLRDPHARDAPPRAALPGLARRAASSGRRGCGHMLRWLQRRLEADSGTSSGASSGASRLTFAGQGPA